MLDAGRRHAVALPVEGEAGIGKTTFAQRVADQGRRQGLAVWGTRVGLPDTALSYSALGDLLRDVADEELDHLPPPQRDALDAALPSCEQ